MRKWLIRAAWLVGLAALVWGLRRTVFAPEPVAVRVAEVGRGTVEATVTNSRAGTVEARRRAGLSTGTAGIVVELNVERGDRVERGQVLLRLDDASQRSDLLHAQCGLEVARAEHARACAAAARAGRELHRNEELFASKLVSEDVLDAARTAAEVAEGDCAVALARIDLAAAAVEMARAELDKTVLRAPFAAIVAEVTVELGEWVTPSVPLMAAPDLIDAIDPTSLYVSAPMDEVDAGSLRVGLAARVRIDSVPERVFQGRLVRAAPYVLDVEKQNRTLEIEVELDEDEPVAALLPGTSADVEVVLEVHEDVPRIPSYALMEGGRVFLVRDERLVEREVGTGLRNWDWTEVRSGLEPGDLVVTSLDRSDVEAGVRVRVERNGEP